MPDHLHPVVSYPATVCIADLVKQCKGTTTRFANEVLTPETFFKWQGSYGAFTISRWDLTRIIDYVEGQKKHHQSGELMPEFEAVQVEE